MHSRSSPFPVSLVVLSLIAFAPLIAWAQDEQGEPLGMQGKNVVLAAVGGRVLSATSEDEAYPAAQLIDGKPGESGWASAPGAGLPQEIVFQLAHADQYMVHTVSIDPRTGYPALVGARWPKEIEVEVATEGTQPGDWHRIARATLEGTGEVETLRFEPVDARWVKLRILSNQGGVGVVEMSEVEVGAVSELAPLPSPAPTAVPPTPVPAVTPPPAAPPTPSEVPRRPVETVPGPAPTPAPAPPPSAAPAPPGPALAPAPAPLPEAPPPAEAAPVPAPVPPPASEVPAPPAPVTPPAAEAPPAPAPAPEGPPAPAEIGPPSGPATAPSPLPEPAVAAPTEVPSPPAEAAPPSAPGPPGATGSLVNLALASGGAKITASSYVTDDYAPSRLIDGSKSESSIWTSHEKPSYPQDLVVELPGGKAYRISRVVVSTNTGPAELFGARWPRQVEVWVSTTGTAEGDFTRIASAELPQTTEDHAIEFEPIQAKYAKLRILSNRGHAVFVEFSELEVWGDPGSGVLVAPPFPEVSAEVPRTPAGQVDVDTLIQRLEILLEQLRAYRQATAPPPQ